MVYENHKHKRQYRGNESICQVRGRRPGCGPVCERGARRQSQRRIHGIHLRHQHADTQRPQRIQDTCRQLPRRRHPSHIGGLHFLRRNLPRRLTSVRAGEPYQRRSFCKRRSLYFHTGSIAILRPRKNRGPSDPGPSRESDGAGADRLLAGRGAGRFCPQTLAQGCHGCGPDGICRIPYRQCRRCIPS